MDMKNLPVFPITLATVRNRMRAQSVEFDGDGHIFWNPEDYERAQIYASDLMKLPKSVRPRGWERGVHKGRCFVKIRLH